MIVVMMRTVMTSPKKGDPCKSDQSMKRHKWQSQVAIKKNWSAKKLIIKKNLSAKKSDDQEREEKVISDWALVVISEQKWSATTGDQIRASKRKWSLRKNQQKWSAIEHFSSASIFDQQAKVANKHKWSTSKSDQQKSTPLPIVALPLSADQTWSLKQQHPVQRRTERFTIGV